VVWLVRRRSDRRLLAMKTIALPPLASREGRAMAERRQALREVEILKGLNSPHVLRHEETVLAPPSSEHGYSELHILTEYCDAGDLTSLLRKANAGPGFTESDVWGLAGAILAGLWDLHTQRILHRDLKPANIFLRYEKGSSQPGSLRRKLSLGSTRARSCGFDPAKVRVLVGDLGIARTVTNTQPLAETMVGTPLYCAPEIFEGEPYDEKADIYSYGVCVYELMHGRPPWADVQHVAGLVRHVLQLDGDPSEHEVKLDPRFSEDLRSLVRDCMARFPKDRPSALELVLRIPAEHRRALGLDVAAIASAPAAEEAAAEATAATAEAPAAEAASGEAKADVDSARGANAGAPELAAAVEAETPSRGRPPQLPVRSASGMSAPSRAESPFGFRPPSRTPSLSRTPSADCVPGEREGLVQTGEPTGPMCEEMLGGDAARRCLASMLEEVPASATLLGNSVSFDITLKPSAGTLVPPQKSKASEPGGRAEPTLASILADACADVSENQTTWTEPILLSTATVEMVVAGAKAADAARAEEASQQRKEGGAEVRCIAPPVAGIHISLETFGLDTTLQRPSVCSTRPASRGGDGAQRPISARAFGAGPGSRPSTPGGGSVPVGYVARAQDYFAKWRREKKEEKMKLYSASEDSLSLAGKGLRSSPPTPARAGGGQTPKRLLKEPQGQGLCLEVRGVAPGRNLKVPQRAPGRL